MPTDSPDVALTPVATDLRRVTPGSTRRAMAEGPKASAVARQHVREVLLAHDVDPDTRADVDLLVSEVVSNFVRHERAVRLAVDVAVGAGHGIAVTVTGGLSQPSEALAHVVTNADPVREHGRGLDILDSLATAWGTRRQYRTTAVWFTVGDPDSTAPAGGLDGPPEPGGATDVLSAAAAVVAEAVAIAAVTEMQLQADPTAAAVQAASLADAAATDAASRTAQAARFARMARLRAANVAAAEVAGLAASTVAAVRVRAEELASSVATAAAEAAQAVSRLTVPGGDAAAAVAAIRLASRVTATAAEKAQETARAAALVATAVAAAAAVATTTAVADADLQDEVLQAAVAMRALTMATAEQLAADAVERRGSLALASSDAAATSKRLHLDNAHLRRAGRHDRTVAHALQAAMLTRLPEPADLQLAARYLTAAQQDQVGGDWYDAVVRPGGSTTLVIGDVVGHDIGAATVMGQLRNMLRVLIWEGEGQPSETVGRLDRVMRDLKIDTMATLLVISVDPAPADDLGGVNTLRWTSAGHPPPILVQRDGTAAPLSAPNDLLLGVRADTLRRDHVVAVPPGSTLLLYTDGLIETRSHDIDHGQRRLLHAVRAHHRLEPGDLLDAVLTDMVGGQPDDDVAVLAVRFGDLGG